MLASLCHVWSWATLIRSLFITHQHHHYRCTSEWNTDIYSLTIRSTLPDQAHTFTHWQARVGFSASVLSVLVICKHHWGIILHNEALQRLPALTLRAKFGSAGNKSLPPPPLDPLSNSQLQNTGSLFLSMFNNELIQKWLLIENWWSIIKKKVLEPKRFSHFHLWLVWIYVDACAQGQMA